MHDFLGQNAGPGGPVAFYPGGEGVVTADHQTEGVLSTLLGYINGT